MRRCSQRTRELARELNSRRAALTVACVFAVMLGLVACGRSAKDEPVEAAADAPQSQAAAATDAPQSQPEPAKSEAAPVAPPPNPAVRPSGWAVASSNNTEKDMQAAEAAAKKSLDLQELPRLRAGLEQSVRRCLRYPDSAQFRDAHMNVAHTALCGEVDYEEWKDGVQGRSGYRRFVMSLDDGAVDTDYPGVHERYEMAAAKIDCTPDLNY